MNQIIPYKSREFNINKPVEIYRCLNRHGKVYSIRQNGVVVAHTNSIQLHDCEFVINPSGKKRVFKTKQRNVHAFIKGFIQHETHHITMSGFITYNPFKDQHFMFNTEYTEGPIQKAQLVNIDDSGVKALLYDSIN